MTEGVGGDTPDIGMPWAGAAGGIGSFSSGGGGSVARRLVVGAVPRADTGCAASELVGCCQSGAEKFEL